jgi:tetratricopeptide (TPR) repeat protein
MKPFPGQREITIRYQGRRYSMAEAGAIAAHALNARNFATALEIFNLMCARLPDSAEVFNNRGAILQQMKRYQEALASYDQAITLKPGYANAHHNRASTLKKLGRYDEALVGFDQAIALKPDHVESHHNRAVILQDLKRYDEALAGYDRVLAFNPNHAEACNNRGLVLSNQGDMAEAGKMFLKASALKPDFTEPLFSLTTIRKYQSVDVTEVKHMRALLDQPGLPSEDKECLYFALGKIFDDCSRYDEAFEFYRLANQIRNAAVLYDAQGFTNRVNGIMEVFNRDFLARPFPFASDSQTPVFVVGMPRSGTTLLAGILSNHPAVATAGELSTMVDFPARLPELAKTNDPNDPFPQVVHHITAELAGRLQDEYLKRLRRDVGPDIPFIIDKNPLNFLNLGLISMLFPQARIIHCARNPLDTGLSTYFQRFPLYLDYSFDLQNIGHFYVEYARLMEHWRKIPTLKMIEVSYEEMISNTESAARKTLDFLGLDWDARCLAPHTNKATVETASRWQVRQPIYRHSLERWHHYEKHLGPLKEILANAGLVTA